MESPDGGDPRDALARARDETGVARDEEAALRDRLADAADAQVEEHERSGQNGDRARGIASGYVIRAARDRERAAADRAGAAAQRAAAARDREFAARDRQLAAADRAHAAAEIAAAGVDEMTGALRRGVGLSSLRREVARAHRTGEPLVLAFVDVDGLKAINDTRGHHAGDLLLERVVNLVQNHLRPYDVTVRVGGDEFVCSLYGVERDGVRERFDLVCADLRVGPGSGSISVGLAELEPGDTLDALIARADAELLAERGVNGIGSRRFRRTER